MKSKSVLDTELEKGGLNARSTWALKLLSRFPNLRLTDVTRNRNKAQASGSQSQDSKLHLLSYLAALGKRSFGSTRSLVQSPQKRRPWHLTPASGSPSADSLPPASDKTLSITHLTTHSGSSPFRCCPTALWEIQISNCSLQNHTWSGLCLPLQFTYYHSPMYTPHCKQISTFFF